MTEFDLTTPTDDGLDEDGLKGGLGDFLYPLPAERNTLSILKWWEKRRLPFNLIVGASGLTTLAVITVVGSLPPNAPSIAFIWAPVIVYAVMANLSFTLGSVLEITIEKLFGPDVLPVGPLLWRAGLTFSLGLTLVLPAIIIVADWIFRIVGWIM